MPTATAVRAAAHTLSGTRTTSREGARAPSDTDNSADKEFQMAKKDMAGTISAADRLLETLTDPLHRQIIENYRRHAILEVCGEWVGIFAPDMTVEVPEYYFNITGKDGLRAVGDEVKAIYRTLSESAATVILVEDEKLLVGDWGFASYSYFNHYMRGTHLAERGIRGYAADGYYVLRLQFAMMWPYDERGRMIGEHVYENKANQQVLEIAPEDFLTVEDARARLLPMLRPLPTYDPATRDTIADNRQAVQAAFR
jgi:hypothetical protein